jgi:hypothetical protein
MYLGRDERSSGRPVSMETVVCPSSLAVLPVIAGKRMGDK